MKTLPTQGIDKQAVQSLAKANMDVIQIGGSSGKDLDLVVVGPDNGPKQAILNLITFTKIASDCFANNDLTIITRLDHMGYAQSRRRILHLLFYPTLDHLVTWELPSFTANLQETGKFLSGTTARFDTLADPYRNDKEFYLMSCSSLHRRAYGSIAASGAVYLCGISAGVPYRLLSLSYSCLFLSST